MSVDQWDQKQESEIEIKRKQEDGSLDARILRVG